MVSATMVDRNGDQAADFIKIRYSEPIKHRRDDDGRYPFTVKGFRIKAVRAVHDPRLLTIVLKPHRSSDLGLSPVITYRPTTRGAVTDRAGHQAVRQSFKGVAALVAPVPAPTEGLLTVEVDGPGSVVSSPEGINCPPTCVAVYPTAAQVSLEAVTGSTEGASFAGWDGACSGSQTSCSVVVQPDTVVGAVFVVEEEPPDDGDDPLPIPLPDPTPLPLPSVLGSGP
jgi:hypothetical protein